jgi:hypothetical protein
MTPTHLAARDRLAQVRLQRLQQAEFALKISHPDVFVSYRAAKSWATRELKVNSHLYPGDSNSGWDVHVIPDPEGYACSISQYWWSADHCGAVRPTGALAIVQAVLELRAGY